MAGMSPDDRYMAPSPQHTSALSVQATELTHRATVGPALARQKRNTCSDGPVISIANTILIVCPRRLREARESGRSLTTKLVKALPEDVQSNPSPTRWLRRSLTPSLARWSKG